MTGVIDRWMVEYSIAWLDWQIDRMNYSWIYTYIDKQIDRQI